MTRHVSHWALVFASLLILSVATLVNTTALAAPLPQDSDFTMEGKITEKSAGKLTLSSGDNIIFHVLYNDSTGIKKADGSAGTADDLKIGVKISVAGSLAESGEITAKTISIEDDNAGKH